MNRKTNKWTFVSCELFLRLKISKSCNCIKESISFNLFHQFLAYRLQGWPALGLRDPVELCQEVSQELLKMFLPGLTLLLIHLKVIKQSEKLKSREIKR